MGLNAVRALSIISLILVFTSTVLVMVHNIEAVNNFLNNGGNSLDMQNCDYIECVLVVAIVLMPWLFIIIRGSTVPNQPAGVFWAVVASVLIQFQALILF
ncbi:hypothetical protein H0H92_001965, partial [Tricholoma furcatifolium]